MMQDSEQQMILTARRSLVSKMSRNQPPRLELFFLNIHVRRSHLVLDSLNEVCVSVCYWFEAKTTHENKKKRVSTPFFINMRSYIFHYMIPNSLDIIDSRLLPVAMHIAHIHRDMSRCLMLQGGVIRITINYLYAAAEKRLHHSSTTAYVNFWFYDV